MRCRGPMRGLGGVPGTPLPCIAQPGHVALPEDLPGTSAYRVCHAAQVLCSAPVTIVSSNQSS